MPSRIVKINYKLIFFQCFNSLSFISKHLSFLSKLIVFLLFPQTKFFMSEALFFTTPGQCFESQLSNGNNLAPKIGQTIIDPKLSLPKKILIIIIYLIRS